MRVVDDTRGNVGKHRAAMHGARALALVTLLPALALAEPRPQPAPLPPRPVTSAELARPDAAVEAQRARFFAAASPLLRARLGPAVKQVLARADAKPKKGEPPNDLLAEAKTSAASVLGGTASPSDVEALAFLVLLQAHKSAQEDLKSIMANVKAIEKTKACKRDPRCLSSLTPTEEITQAQLDAARAKLDSLSEMGEMESLRMQMAMDRLSKVMSTLSNIMKKMSETSSSIVQNLK